ncbi:hypothetical protein RRG08_043116 [Elysia crispata]|uniref:Uncharacterized protein n=1 Tax=Elysia crispata TaxID=231223 RepID=A0AAE0XY39_9GAST|nr:hypothetical protein RRG08_043116 [Elysia crispata]
MFSSLPVVITCECRHRPGPGYIISHSSLNNSSFVSPTSTLAGRTSDGTSDESINYVGRVDYTALSWRETGSHKAQFRCD